MINKEALKTVLKENGSFATKGQAGEAIDAVFGAIQDSLEVGETVSIAKFGKFEVRERAARTGRNPQTGEALEIAETKAPAFKPSETLKNLIKA
jgi:DNA-binding protein HU-beta